MEFLVVSFILLKLFREVDCRSKGVLVRNSNNLRFIENHGMNVYSFYKLLAN